MTPLLDHLPASVLELEDELQVTPLYEDLFLEDDVEEASRVQVLMALEEEPIDWHGIMAASHLAITKEREQA